MQDIFGQTTTLTDPQALASWNKTQLAFLAHGASTPEHLSATLEAEPQFALGHAIKAMFMLLLGRRELIETAREAHRTSLAALKAKPVSQREQHFIDASTIWLQGHPKVALHHFEMVLENHPDDALAMKLDHAVRFVLGDGVGMRAMIERVRPAYENNHPGLGYLLGCHAFALEETGDYSRARTTGLEGLLMAPDDAWGLHAVAHVYDMTADAAGGIRWLTGRDKSWAHCNNFRYHVWWHKALMHLDLGDYDAVLNLYDDKIREDKTDDYRDISNATSLLSRLELDGIEIGDRWEELADISANRTEDGCLIFADLHYMLALIGGNREEAVATLMSRLQRDARENLTDMQKAMMTPGLNAAAGLEAFGGGDYESAFLNLLKARPYMIDAGGSHAQRDVFERLTIDSGIRAGRFDDAAAILNQRIDGRGGHADGYADARMNMIAVAQNARNRAKIAPVS